MAKGGNGPIPGPVLRGTQGPGSWLHAAMLTAFLGAMIYWGQHLMYWTPEVQPLDAPAATFSEARARQHVKVLAEDIGGRQVSTEGLQEAHRYLMDQGRRLERLAAARNDLTVKVDMENVTGAYGFDFMGHNGTNAFRKLTNIFILVSPKAAEEQLAVMISAHQDSPVSSQGASDDASNVGIMLELASNLVAKEQLPAAPILFFFSGGEEPLCQSASGFMQQSKWASKVAAFINLESIGPGGVPIVFQHAGAWVIEAFAQGAKHPRGAVAAQDIFDAGLIVGETDFRQMSYRDQGSLPGIDMAFILDAAAYHTDRDSLERIRKGTLQDMGETLTGAIDSLAAAIAAAGPEGQQALLQPDDHKAVFFDIGNAYMVTYRMATAKLLHNLPLVLTLSMPYVLTILHPDEALPVASASAAMVWGAFKALSSYLLCILLPGAFGALRAVLTGRAMVWYSHSCIAYSTAFPVAFVALLVPYLSTRYESSLGYGLLPYDILGGALVNAVLAAVGTHFGFGVSFFYAIWAVAGALASPFLIEGLTPGGLLGALAVCALPTFLCAEKVLAFTIALTGRMNLTGHIFVGLGDAAAGVLLGLGAAACGGMVLTPMIRAALGKTAKKLTAALFLGAVVLAGYASYTVHPYTPAYPKRLLANHVHHTEVDPSATGRNADHPVMRVVNASWAFGGADSTSLSMLLPHLGIKSGSRRLPATGREWSVVFPVHSMLEVHAYPARPLEAPIVPVLPYVKLVGEEGRAGGMYERVLQLEVYSDAPCWGLLNITGPLRSWDVTPELTPHKTASGGVEHVVRWTTEAVQTPWPLELVVGPGEKLRLELHVAYLQATEPLKGIRSRLPDWATLSYECTSYVSIWEF